MDSRSTYARRPQAVFSHLFATASGVEREAWLHVDRKRTQYRNGDWLMMCRMAISLDPPPSLNRSLHCGGYSFSMLHSNSAN